ncbi:MAG: hypothetical protein ACK6AD_03600 [Cyanobacteriota bacterium]
MICTGHGRGGQQRTSPATSTAGSKNSATDSGQITKNLAHKGFGGLMDRRIRGGRHGRAAMLATKAMIHEQKAKITILNAD